MILRKWQSEILSRYKEICLMHKKFILKAPTGAGKTILASEIIKKFYKKKKIIVLCHRLVLLEQLEKELSIDHKVKKLGISETSTSFGSSDIILSTNLRSQNAIVEIIKDSDLIIIDEAHRVSPVGRAYKNVLDVFDEKGKHNSRIMGLTASPERRTGNQNDQLGLAFDAIIDIVLKGSCNTTLVLGKNWLKNNVKGSILNIVTTYAWTGSGYVVPSAVSKAGVLAMTRSLAVEWGKNGIRSNAIAPGPFPTKGAWDRLFPKEIQEKVDMKSRIPLNRFGEHHELTNLAGYLMSDYSSFINGEVITIDGGEWLKSGGEFNWLDVVGSEMWDDIEKSIRGAKKS